MLEKSVMLLSLPLLLISSITVHSDICRVPTQPVITVPTAGMEFPDPIIIVEGTTTQHSTVSLKTNDHPLGDTTSDASGNFQVQVTLDRGENHLTAQTSNPCGTSSTASVNVSVAELEPTPEEPTPSSPPANPLSPALPGMQPIVPDTQFENYDNQQNPATNNPSSPQNNAPTQGLELRITSPDDHSTTTEDSVFLTGITNQDSTEVIDVNNKEIAHLTVPSNTFGVLAPLHMGKNTIKVTATSGDQSATAIVHVTRINPLPQNPPWYETYWYVIAVPLLLLTTVLFGIARKGRYDEI